MIVMPPSDQAVLSRREEIITSLRLIVPGEGVITSNPSDARSRATG